MQSDIWGIYNINFVFIMHITAGDFSVNPITINGWLRNFLWSQSAQVIYSGRGYWQELIESILWALSISQGRGVVVLSLILILS